MPAYRPQDLEKKWQAHWQQHRTFQADNQSNKPKYYVLDMFPYPSGAGLHVGHPLGYIASDIVARFQRLQGRNVLHPMGFDSFGLPAEQYAIQTGQAPALTTDRNIETYIRQLRQLGFSYDWDREIRTSDPAYYKWTQWIFLKLFNCWYNLDTDRAENIRDLQAKFEENGSTGIRAAGDEGARHQFTAGQWKLFTEHQRLEVVHTYRLAYQQDTYVNWCPALGTVLSNDEVKDGLSERGGYPVERRLMPQWNLRITAYADRLLAGLDTLDWPDAVKEMQRNWIGRSTGASVRFGVLMTDLSHAYMGQFEQPEVIEVFTTRLDTIYGATFLVLAPEHPLTLALGERAYRMTEGLPESADIWQNLQAYVEQATNRSERERQADTKTVSGANTGFFVRNPFGGQVIPVWTADYVLAGYGTGAVMAVPSGDQRDWLFATHFGLPIVAVSDAQCDLDKQADPTKEGRYINSELINGLNYQEANARLLAYLEETATPAGYVPLEPQRGRPPAALYQEAQRIGEPKITYRLRDAIFGRQRYWGEPIPIYYKDGTAYGVSEADLPLVLPEIDEYRPTETGEPPLGRAKDWKYRNQFDFELSTMPGWAGSSWYFLRYMDPHNAERFVGEAAEKYWGQVDLYMGGAEHATGHLLYSRFWYLFLKDLGLVSCGEPFQKLVNQGMILGRSSFVYQIWTQWQTIPEEELHFPQIYVSKSFIEAMSQNSWGFESSEKYLNYLAQIDEIISRTKANYPHLKMSLMRHNAPTGEYAYFSKFHVDVNHTNNDILDISAFRNWRNENRNAEFILEEDGIFICDWEVEKMSKSKYNVVNPDVLIDKFGADALRLYEMFLGPLEQFKPWNTNGISGVATFLKKFWRLFHPEDGALAVTDEPATPAELKALHRVIQKVAQDIDKFSFNTSVSTFMIATNELTALGCHKRAILEPLLIVLSPFAPHLAEELWEELGHYPGSISYAAYPEFREEYLVEANVTYPVAINGKVREQRQFAATATATEIEAAVLESDFLSRFGEGKAVKKVVVVPGRMVNVVV